MNKYLSKSITVNNKTYILSLDYILGLFEGDGSIYIQLKPNASHKTGKQVILNWDIHQHVIDVDLLSAISLFLECGKVEIGRKLGKPDTWVYRFRVSNQRDIINILLPILQSNSMILSKRDHDKKLFIEICHLIINKVHITNEGQNKILNLISQLSSKMSLDEKRMLPKSLTSFTPDRILGLTDAEGNFHVELYPKIDNPNFKSVNFRFSITQENTEINFLNELVKFFGCGRLSIGPKGQGGYYVSNKKEIEDKIIPFFNLNKLQTIKKYSFLNFQKAFNIAINNKPLLNTHWEELIRIKADDLGKRPKK